MVHFLRANFYENLRKMEKINGINLREGYSKHIELVNPMEVITDEN